MRRLHSFILTLPSRTHSANPIPRTLCSVSGTESSVQRNKHRRRHVGLPKGLDHGFPVEVLTAEESPWEDYLIPDLRGNCTPNDASRYISPNSPPFYVLGVETSCDDTAAAIVSSTGQVLSDVREGQELLNAAWGGVVPHIARDAHENAISRVIHRAVEESNLNLCDIQAVAATMGPGLEVCLRVGYRAARSIARDIQADFVGVNHLEAHVMVARLEHQIEFPFLTLLVSGGHCQLLLVKDVADYVALGGTLDDALGEAYDKTARLLALDGAIGNGGGPAMEQVALGGDHTRIPFPVPMQKRGDCNFSFAGLKTSVRTAVQKLGGIESVRNDKQLVADLAASFQHIAVTHLEERTRRAIRRCKPHNVKSLVVSGGVASNRFVRRRLAALAEKEELECIFPAVRLCTDNAVMVAWSGCERLFKSMATDPTNMDVRARWPLATYEPLP